MEDVLAVYTRPRDGDCPLVCLDETSKRLIAETRVPMPMKAGAPGTFRLRVPAQRHHQSVHDVCSARRLAPCQNHRSPYPWITLTSSQDLADIHYAHAKTIVLVQDNLSIR